MALQTTNVTLPTSVALAIVEKAKDTSTIAALFPADTINGFLDDKYNVFTGAAEADVVAEGAKKSGYEQTVTHVEGKRFTVQVTIRVSKQLQWADEADQLKILDAIQADQANAIGRALDIVVYHALNPKTGTALDGYTALDTTAAQVTAGKDEIANIDALAAAVQDWDINGIALSRTWAAKLRTLRTSTTGSRLYPTPSRAPRPRPSLPRSWLSSATSPPSSGVWPARSPPRSSLTATRTTPASIWPAATRSPTAPRPFSATRCSTRRPSRYSRPPRPPEGEVI